MAALSPDPHSLLARTQAALPAEDQCRAAALAAAQGSVEDGATWPYLWPGGLRLAADLCQLLPAPDPQLLVVDLGCGRGLLGMMALMLGFERVVFADGDALPLSLIEPCLQPFPQARCQTVVWGEALAGDAATLILGGDILYRPTYHPALLATIAGSLSAQGQALLGDPRHGIEADFPAQAASAGLHCDCELRPGPYTLCRLSHQDWDRLATEGGPRSC